MLMTSLTKAPLKELIKDHSNIVNHECLIKASNDVEAIEIWLREYMIKPTTFRTYKKEAERFLIWCHKVRQTSLSHLKRDDVEAYILFLQNPHPKEIWCGPRHKKGDKWYPFTGPLSANAIKLSLIILNSLMSYLIDAHYINVNPFQLIKKKHQFKNTIDEQQFRVYERILNDEEWQALRLTLNEENDSDHNNFLKKNRLRFLVAVLYFLGLRIEELSRAVFKDCYNIDGKWWFLVRGKGDRLGKIPINSQLLHEIMVYRQNLGLLPLPHKDEVIPLISQLSDVTKALTARQMSNLLKDLAIKSAHKFSPGSSSYEKLLQFSPHWLRHLSASKQDLAGISLTNIKNNLRHQNEQTTRIYIHAHDEQRHNDMEKLKF